MVDCVVVVIGDQLARHVASDGGDAVVPQIYFAYFILLHPVSLAVIVIQTIGDVRHVDDIDKVAEIVGSILSKRYGHTV